jgi:hypothetical protein
MLNRVEIKRIAAAEWQRNNPERAAKRKRDWYLKNKELCIKRAREHKQKKKAPTEILTPEQKIERRKQYMSDYYNNNKNIIIARWLETKKRYMLDPLYRTKESVRRRISRAFVQKGFTKRSKTFEIVGCSFEELKLHIEKQFVEGMSWDNRSKWHIDHMVPLSVAMSEDELVKLGHYSNLRPLSVKDNFEKSDSMLEEFIPLRIALLGR